MRIIPLVLAAAATLALAVPAPSKHLQKRSFKAASYGRAVNAVDDFNRVHQKYGDGSWTVVVVEGSYIEATTTSASTYATGTGSPVHPSSTATPTYGNNTNEDGEVDAAPEENESEYLSPVHIGGQLLNLNFDTGSADLWVFSTELIPEQIGGHSVYNHKKSDSWSLLTDATWNISYGDGSGAGGIVGFDTVDVGGSTVDKQCVELAQYVSPAFVRDDNSDGLLGLSFSSISTVQPKPQKTFFENVKDDLSEPLFTADLEETNGKGTYEFGTIDKSKYKGDMHWTVVDNSDGWWQITVPRVKIGNNTTQKCTACTPMIADTGTSLLYLNQDIVDAYYNQIKGATNDDGLLAVPCDSKMPDLGLELGDGYFATLKGEEMIYMESPYIAGLCWGGLQYSPGHIQIMGDVFLKQFFAVFDGGENLRFGVAEKN